jgi:tubulin-specific chaperone B
MKLELITGIPVSNQLIQLLDREDDTNPVNLLSEDDRPLGYYGVRDMQVLNVSSSS